MSAPHFGYFDISNNKRLNRYINYHQLLELILKIHPDLLTAFKLKKSYIIFNKSNNSPNDALASIHDFYDQFLSSNISEFLPIVSALGNWDKEIVNSFYIYNGRRISSGMDESINSTISTIILTLKVLEIVKEERKESCM